MGFAARTIFWLGLVYSANPLDFGSLFAEPVAIPADANPLAACALGATEVCRRRADDLRKVLNAATALGVLDRGGAAAEAPVLNGKPRPARRPPQSRSS